jgi:hypothetical protein
MVGDPLGAFALRARRAAGGAAKAARMRAETRPSSATTAGDLGLR